MKTKITTRNALCGLISGLVLLAAGTLGAQAGSIAVWGNNGNGKVSGTLTGTRFTASILDSGMVFNGAGPAAQVPLVFDGTNTGTTGANEPLENRQPTLGTGYMIAVQGIVPDNSSAGPVGTQPPNRATPFLGEIKAIPFHFAPGGWMLCEGQSLLTSQNTALFNLIGYTFGGSGANFNLPDLRDRVPIGAGQGGGLPNYQLGDVVGIKNPVMSVANLPAHTHTITGGNTGATGNGAPLENRQPSLALHFLIAANGEIMIAPWTREPTGWAHCDGRMLNMANYGYLFSNIHTTYGGNGAPNFALPDLRGRTPIGDDSNLAWPLGLAYGVNENVLSVSAIAAHTHTITGGNTGSTGGPGGTANNYQPSLVMRWMMSLFGAFPNPGNAVGFPMVAEMRLVAGPAVDGVSQDDGWAPLFGQLENINENETLFNLIGTTYGGDGQDTFALPNLEARVDAGVSPQFVLGETAGTDTLSISVSKLAAHAHSLSSPPVGSLQFTAANYDDNETNTTHDVTVTVSRTDGSSGAVSVHYATSDGTTTAGSDYTATSGDLNWADGDMADKSFTVSVTGETTFEDDETINLTLSDPTGGATLGTPSEATITILNDDTAPTYSIDNVSMGEGDSGMTSFVFTVTKNGASEVTTSVNYQTMDGTATTADNDYQPAMGTLTFAPNETMMQVTVLVNADTKYENDETFTVELTASPAPGRGPRGSSTMGLGTIQNDDSTPSFSIEDVTAEEGTGGITGFVFTVTKTGDTELSSSVDFQTMDGSATSGENDYQAMMGTLNFGPSDTMMQVTVFVNGDTIHESDEMFTVQLSNAMNATISDDSATGTITNDDAAPTFSIDDVTMAEGDGGPTSFVFTVTKNGATELITSVNYQTMDGTATAADNDYQPTMGALNFGPTDTMMQITVLVNGDMTYEDNDAFTVELSTPPVVGRSPRIVPTIGTGTITNDDSAPSLSIDSVMMNEGDGGTTIFTFTVTKTGSTAFTSTVDFMTQDGTATLADNDYLTNSGTLTFQPSDKMMQVTVFVNGDTTVEPDETFTVHLSNSTNATINQPDGIGTITNDDGAPSFSIDDVTMDEGDSGTTMFTFTVTKTGDNGGNSSLSFHTMDGSATIANNDYQSNSGSLFFLASDSTMQITVLVNGDTNHETTEDFTVELTAGTNAVIGDGSGTATITNDDGAPGVTNTNDSGPGSLRQALADAADGDTIAFNFGPNLPAPAEAPLFVITLTSGQLVINSNVTIMGLGADVLEVTRDSNAANFRIFHVFPGHTVTIEGLTISNGRAADYGGGIYNRSSALTVNSCMFSGNASFYGAGIFNDVNTSGQPASVTVTNSTFNGNVCDESGGAIQNEGPGDGTAVLTVNNSTFSGNSNLNTAGGAGGAIHNYGGVLTVANSTFSKNSAPNASGIFNFGTLDIGNTILESCASGANIMHAGLGVATSHGYNLSSDAGGGVLTAPGDQINTDPMLGVLKDNGGPTLTIAPVINSPALDQGKRDTIVTLSTNFDQRGSARPVNDPDVTNAAGGDASDIGAVELGEFVHPTNAASRKTHGTAGDFDVDLPFMNFANSPIGIECRSGGAAGVYTVIMNFAGNVSFTSAAVTSCGTTGSVSTASGSGTSEITISLTGITDVQTLTLALFDVDDGTNISDVGLRMRVHTGDVTANDVVNSSDVSSVKSELGRAVDGMNFRSDVTANGVINASDVTLTKSKMP